MGGETSGYGSDNHQSPEISQQIWNNHNAGYESSSSYRDDRMKWGDRGVGFGKFWGHKELNHYDKTMNSDTPGWVKRGLERQGELIVANSSPAESPEQDFGDNDRPCTGSTTSQPKTYIRGQNIPLDTVELAERERRRQIALAHQQAIRQQLEEKEKRRKEERERKIREEREEELRIERERELDRQRRELELKKIQEKSERERKRNEVLHEALEKAATDKVEKQKLLKQNINENIKEKNKSPRKEEIASNNNHVTNDIQEDKLNNEKIDNKPEVKHQNIKETNRIEDEVNNNKSLTPRQQIVAIRDNNLAVMLPTHLDLLQGMQFAVLMPNGLPQALPLAIPIAMENTNERTQNRLLTPTQYRNNKQFCDSSTQTDSFDCNQNEAPDVAEKLSTLDINDNRNKKLKERKEVERPKWGVNKPQMRYLKQSEKDPLYQRRKIKQKIRQVKVYNDKYSNYSARSSDDSESNSPVHNRRRERVNRPSWRKNEHLFARNVSVYQTEIIPLESDRDQIYYKQHTHRCCCQCYTDKIHQNKNELPQCSSFGSIDDSQGD